MLKKNELAAWIALVVEDTFDDEQLMSKILSFSGITVHVARNGREGLELLERIAPTFIVTDLAMPGKDGWQMLQDIRTNAQTAHIPVIAVTAYDSAAVANDVDRVGFDAYFTKPVDPLTFVQQLQTLLGT